jgi:hypothetical protein
VIRRPTYGCRLCQFVIAHKLDVFLARSIGHPENDLPARYLLGPMKQTAINDGTAFATSGNATFTQSRSNGIKS